MGATRKTGQHLPKRTYWKHGAYWYVAGNVWTKLSADQSRAIEAANALNALKPSDRAAVFTSLRAIPERLWHDVMADGGHRCAYCGATENLGIDHVVPIVAGGATAPFNLVIACLSCNASKGQSYLGDFMARMPAIREALMVRALALLDKEPDFIRQPEFAPSQVVDRMVPRAGIEPAT